jgi:IclR family mhp operon transcriptional activator
MPILACAAGLVQLAFCPDDEREKALGMLQRFGDKETQHMLQLAQEGGLLATVRASGYAARGYNRFTRNPGKTSSIAVPIMVDDVMEGALTIAFFAATIEIRKAVRDLLQPLRECAAAIARDMVRDRSAERTHTARPLLRQV